MTVTMKKMVLVPESLVDTVSRQSEAASTPELDAVVRLGREMEALRARRDLSLAEKTTRYQEALRQYLHFRDELHKERSTTTTPAVVVPSSQQQAAAANLGGDTPAVSDIESITETLPKSAQQHGKKLLNVLKNVISWDNDTKELIYDGQVVPKSNIRDLVYDTVVRHKGSAPVGSVEFSAALSRARVPRNLLRNVNRFGGTSPQKRVSPVQQQPQQTSDDYSSAEDGEQGFVAGGKRPRSKWLTS